MADSKPTGGGLEQILSEAFAKLDAATEPALNYAVEKGAQMVGGLLGMIPLVGEAMKGTVETLTANRGGMDANFMMPSVPRGESVMAASVPSQQLSIDPTPLPEQVKTQAVNVQQVASAAKDVSPGDLGTMVAPPVFDGKVRAVGGREV